MKRTPGISHISRISGTSGASSVALFGAMVLLAVMSASAAAVDAGPGPFGVTVTAAADAESARVGALFPADRVSPLAKGHYCTASVVHSPQGDLIVTAAHCVGGDRSDLVFAPGYRDGKAPYGLWKVGRRYLPDRWSQGQDEDSDVAFAVVAEQADGEGKGEGKGKEKADGEKGDGAGAGERVEAVVGANRLVTGMAIGATAVTVTGYPDSGEVPISCSNRPSAQSRTQQRIACPGFTGGTSGSPWVDGDHEVVGILGGHEEGGSTPDVSYSVALGAEVAELYQDAVRGG
ncbi:trypsin-like serine peptidase [Streptomyces sp. MMS24-I2-30]|uniref:trypsin-like serine peptidase n=1 Tax=Streptomyces sp. MMS24-I2-30 TaxID=3351564 RepID=UPI003896B640